MRRTVAGRLSAARRRALVGRDAELARVRDFLAGDERVLLHVHGPGGVGKTTLLRAAECEAEDDGRVTRWVDAGALPPSLDALVAAVGGLSPDPGTVLLLDRAEALGAHEPWLWDRYLPSLPEGCHVVVGSRRPPPPERWRDPGWRSLISVLPLRNLPARDAEALLRIRGVPDDVDVEDVVRSTHGHPLALAIAADEYAERGEVAGGPLRPGVLVDHPDAAARLLATFVDDVVDPHQRRALHVCGHSRRVDRALLASVLEVSDESADELLAWLRARPYSESHPDGLAVHDLVRDALDRDLRWRDRDEFSLLHRRIRDVVVERMARATGSAHASAAADLLFLHRGNPDAATLYAFEDLGTLADRPAASAQDREAVVAAFTGADGPERGAAVAGWLGHQPEAGHLVVAPGGRVVGGVVTAELTDPGPTPDPAAGVVLAELRRRRPPEPGEQTLLHVIADAEDPDRLGGFSDAVAALSLRVWARPDLGWVTLASTHGATWIPIWGYIGFEPLVDIPLADGRVLTAWARDFGRSGYAEWLDALTESELATGGTAPPPVASPVALARDDFGEAVRDALRDHARPARLRSSPLLTSRLARPRSGEDPATVDPVARLREAVSAGVAAVGRQPRGDSPARVLDRTYLRPAASQELAAEVLDLPFGTYRRHLRAGVEALVEVLWDWELHGPPGPEVDSN
ncbi:ATP-binding protein [Nocardioides aestuarii]|uniref:ATP-binding protein n=1 Tax=Nocardioides aestuarii TaxID=252231 RepID=A0ABW4TKJ5_9ACTN